MCARCPPGIASLVVGQAISRQGQRLEFSIRVKAARIGRSHPGDDCGSPATSWREKSRDYWSPDKPALEQPERNYERDANICSHDRSGYEFVSQNFSTRFLE